MINKYHLALCALFLSFISTTAIAGKPEEALIYHCGCSASNEFTVEAGSELRWKLLIVNANSKGHQNHQIGDIENCTYFDQESVEQENQLVRGSNDCEVGDLLTGVSTCESEPVAGDTCAQQTTICPCTENPEWDAFLESGPEGECGDGPFGVFANFTRLQNTQDPVEYAFANNLYGDRRCGTVTNADGFVGFEFITADEEAACAQEIVATGSALGNDCTAW